MTFCVSIVGLPNTGKSTLFNTICGYRRSIVSSQPGTTNTIIGQKTQSMNTEFLLQDTPGVMSKFHKTEDWEKTLKSDLVICVIDGTKEISIWEKNFYKTIKRYFGSRFIFVVNKCDCRIISDIEFLKLGLGDPIFASALMKFGISPILQKIETVEQSIEKNNDPNEDDDQKKVHHMEKNIFLFGRPNSGKSSIFNFLLKQDISRVSNEEFETRDIVESTIVFNHIKMNFFDSSGLIGNQKNELKQSSSSILESFMEKLNFAVLVVDKPEQMTTYDKKIIGMCGEKQIPLMVIINRKTDLALDPLFFIKKEKYNLVTLQSFNSKDRSSVLRQISATFHILNQKVDTEDLSYIAKNLHFIESIKQIDNKPEFKLRYRRPLNMHQMSEVKKRISTYFYDSMPVVKLIV